MSSDQARHVPDVPFKGAGIGQYASFCCARCRKNVSLMGRKMQLVRGAKAYVCKGCAK